MLLRHLFSIDFLFYSATNEAVAVGVSALCSDQGAAAVPNAMLSAGTRVQSSGGHSANHIGGQFPGVVACQLLTPFIANRFRIHLEFDMIYVD